MFSLPYLCICIYCMVQLIFLIVMANRRQIGRAGHEKYFLWMLVITLCSFTADILSSLYTGPDWVFPFSAAGNYIEIILNTLLLPVFYRYICEQIYNPDLGLMRRLNTILWIMASVCYALLASTAISGKIFYFDSTHIYHRGPLFLLPMFILFAMMIIIESFLVFHKQKIEVGYYKSLVFFLVAPMIGWALQAFIFGLPFSLLGITFAAQIVFTNIQNRNIDKDYLTGAFTRQALDGYMQHKIDISASHTSFAAILLDIDDFKFINDHFGHYEGDTALINTVRLLRDSVGHKDFIARYGGDEFCVILQSDDSKIMESTLSKINSHLLDFNKRKDKPYALSFSMGYAVYHPSAGNRAEQFFKIIDKKMYEEKNARRCSTQNADT